MLLIERCSGCYSSVALLSRPHVGGHTYVDCYVVTVRYPGLTGRFGSPCQLRLVDCYDYSQLVTDDCYCPDSHTDTYDIAPVDLRTLVRLTACWTPNVSPRYRTRLYPFAPATCLCCRCPSRTAQWNGTTLLPARTALLPCPFAVPYRVVPHTSVVAEPPPRRPWRTITTDGRITLRAAFRLTYRCGR